MKSPAFCTGFTSTNTDHIVEELKVNGFFAFEQALNEEYIDAMLAEINFEDVLVNTNNPGVVVAQNNKFLTHCLATSEKAYNIVTDPKVLDICKSYFTSSYKLTNHRIYETFKSSHMPWHTDNNLQEGPKLSGKHTMPGLLFLFYLSDVEKNAFQLVKRSHHYSKKYINEVYLSDEYVAETYKDDILTFKMKRGSLILCDIHGIHRAEPFTDKSYKRKTMLFQIDQVGNGHDGHGESNIVNTEYLKNLTPEVMDYLGFGFKRDYPAFPNSSLSTLSLGDMVAVQKKLVKNSLTVLARTVVKAVLPGSALVNLKRSLWSKKQKKVSQA